MLIEGLTFAGGGLSEPLGIEELSLQVLFPKLTCLAVVAELLEAGAVDVEAGELMTGGVQGSLQVADGGLGLLLLALVLSEEISDFRP
ncbi:MAG: hypothetical protein RLZZ468_650, partial [Cyanobacteriota bacterium]